MNGDVIGINTAILGKGGSVGIGFSIPSNSAKKVVSQLIEFGETKRGWLDSTEAMKTIGLLG
jgi:serine protease Do